MTSQKVLIVGAGVAGSITAFWLAKYGFEVVVVERAKPRQKLGQGIEIEEPALGVVRAMEIMDELEARKTDEKGFDLLDGKDRLWARFDVNSRLSVTGALELMRGDMTEVFYEAANKFANVTYHFETVIQTLKQTQDKVTVDLENRTTEATRTEEFDYVIGADGSKSRTRQLVMGSDEDLQCLKPVSAFVSYFSIPKEEQDWPYSRACQFPGGRIAWLRPIGKDSDMTSVYLIHTGHDLPSLRRANAAGDRLQQKKAFAESYRGLGWEAPRIIKQIMTADNFYSDELMQVKLSKWSQHRVVLVGDAAWAPTPFTGEGTQLAILGAWVLAQEMSRNRNLAGLENYEKRFRPYVENAQQLPLGGYAQKIACPQTSLGIWLFRTTLYSITLIAKFLTWTGLTAWLPAGEDHPPFDLEIDTNEAKKAQ